MNNNETLLNVANVVQPEKRVPPLKLHLVGNRQWSFRDNSAIIQGFARPSSIETVEELVSDEQLIPTEPIPSSTPEKHQLERIEGRFKRMLLKESSHPVDPSPRYSPMIFKRKKTVESEIATGSKSNVGLFYTSLGAAAGPVHLKKIWCKRFSDNV